MSQTLDELAEILTQIEAMHGTIQAMDDHIYVRGLHAKARACIETLRKEDQETGKLIKDLEEEVSDWKGVTYAARGE